MSLVALTLSLAIPPNSEAYHVFEQPGYIWTDIPNPDVIEQEPKTAVAEAIDTTTGFLTRYVYAVWWHGTDLWFRRHTGEGLGSWFETPVTLATAVSPDPTDIAITAYGNNVWVAWSEYPSGTQRVQVRKSTTNGESWNAAYIPAPEPTFNIYYPDLAVSRDDTGVEYVYLARVKVAGNPIIQVVRLEPTEVSRDITTTENRAWFPTVAAHGSKAVVAFDRCTTCTGSDYQVFVSKSSDAGFTWTGAFQVSATASARAPDIASHGRFLHLLWRQSTNVVYERSVDFGDSWDSGTRVTVASGASGQVDQSQQALDAYGHAVAVVYKDAAGLPTTRRNINNGEAGSAWQTPETVDSLAAANAVDLAVDPRHDIAGEKGNIVHYAWTNTVAGRTDVRYIRRPTEEREWQTDTFTEFTEAQGQSAVYAPFRGEGYVFGGNAPGQSNKIWRLEPNTQNGDVILQTHTLQVPISYSSAIWDDSGASRAAYIFGGASTGGVTACVHKYTGTASATCLANVGSGWTARMATSAAFDGSTYAYVFGGKTSTGLGVGYTNQIRRFNVNTEKFGWSGGCNPILPTAIAFSSATWDSVQGVAYIFGGESGLWTNYYRVLKFNPAALPCPTVTDVGQLPCTVWDYCGSQEQLSVRVGPGTVAAHVGGSTILVAGGRHLFNPVIGGDFVDSRYVWSFNTGTNAFTLKFVDLPACKSHGAAFWYPDPVIGRLYYFSGFLYPSDSAEPCEAGGNQVVRYDLNTH